MVLNAYLVSCFHLEALQRVLCLGNNDIALGHGISPFQITGSTAADSGDLLPYPLPRYRVRRNCQTTLQPFVSAIQRFRSIIGESRCNTIVVRKLENIISKF